MRRFLAPAFVVAAASVSVMGCTHPAREVSISRAVGGHGASSRAGIAVVANGGASGWEHVTVLDSATARYVTVTRRSCHEKCTPIDSAMGTLTPADVERIYAIADSERAYFQAHKNGACAACEERALVTTAVFGNRRRMVVRTAPEASPEVLGRVHVALAEAIRAARMPGSADVGGGPPND